METTTQQLKEQYDRSPQDTRSLLLDNDFGPMVTLACENAGLDANTGLDIEDIVVDILLGTIQPKDLLIHLYDLDIPEKTTQKLVEGLVEDIFSQVEISLKETNHIEKSLLEEILGEKTTPVHSLADDILGTYKKVETEPVLIKPEVISMKVAKETLPTPQIPINHSVQKLAETPENLPGATFENKIIPKVITPEQKPSSIYPVPPIENSDKKGPSDEASSDIKIPENIFEAKLRQVSESLEGSEEQNTPNQVPKPPKQDPNTDPYREPLG